MGFPVMTVSKDSNDPKTVRVTQQRFLVHPDTDPQAKWVRQFLCQYICTLYTQDVYTLDFSDIS